MNKVQHIPESVVGSGETAQQCLSNRPHLLCPPHEAWCLMVCASPWGLGGRGGGKLSKPAPDSFTKSSLLFFPT